MSINNKVCHCHLNMQTHLSLFVEPVGDARSSDRRRCDFYMCSIIYCSSPSLFNCRLGSHQHDWSCVAATPDSSAGRERLSSPITWGDERTCVYKTEVSASTDTLQTAAVMADFLGKALGNDGIARAAGQQAGEFGLNVILKRVFILLSATASNLRILFLKMHNQKLKAKILICYEICIFFLFIIRSCFIFYSLKCKLVGIRPHHCTTSCFCSFLKCTCKHAHLFIHDVWLYYRHWDYWQTF